MRLWGADLRPGTKGIADRPCLNALARELPLPPAGEGGGEGACHATPTERSHEHDLHPHPSPPAEREREPRVSVMNLGSLVDIAFLTEELLRYRGSLVGLG